MKNGLSREPRAVLLDRSAQPNLVNIRFVAESLGSHAVILGSYSDSIPGSARFDSDGSGMRDITALLCLLPIPLFLHKRFIFFKIYVYASLLSLFWVLLSPKGLSYPSPLISLFSLRFPFSKSITTRLFSSRGSFMAPKPPFSTKTLKFRSSVTSFLLFLPFSSF